MNVDELAALVRRRFRLALFGYVVLALAAGVALAVSYDQQHSIKRNENSIGALAVCDAPKKVRTELGVDAAKCVALLRTYRRYTP